MKVCLATIRSATPYSQSKALDPDMHPKLDKELADAYDKRLWREKATYDANGAVCIPAMALKMSVDEAVKRLNIGINGRGKSTYTKFFVAGQICEGDVPIGIHKDDLDYIDIWANADGVRGSGKRVRRRFPIIKEWEATARFAILDPIIPEDVFEKALTEAGRLVGIGRFRPEKGGFLGRFPQLLHLARLTFMWMTTALPPCGVSLTILRFALAPSGARICAVQQIALKRGSTVSASTTSPTSVRRVDVVLIPARFRMSKLSFTPLDLPFDGLTDELGPLVLADNSVDALRNIVR